MDGFFRQAGIEAGPVGWARVDWDQAGAKYHFLSKPCAQQIHVRVAPNSTRKTNIELVNPYRPTVSAMNSSQLISELHPLGKS